MKITWFGTASIAIESNNEKIIFDPFVPMRGSNVNVKLDDYFGYDKILITHGHFDHIDSLKDIYLHNNNIKIYCTLTPYKYLNKKGIPLSNLELIKPLDKINFNNFKIVAHHSEHIKYDDDAIKKIIKDKKSYKYLYNVPSLIYKNKVCLENNEIVLYEVNVENKTIIIMGSLGIDKEVSYPSNVDLFVMPYQGKEDLLTPAKEVINVLKPKKILLSHYDNTFPPVSKDISTGEIIEKYKDIIPIIKINNKDSIEL